MSIILPTRGRPAVAANGIAACHGDSCGPGKTWENSGHLSMHLSRLEQREVGTRVVRGGIFARDVLIRVRVRVKVNRARDPRMRHRGIGVSRGCRVPPAI
jgi:hypothetical protein